MTAARIHADRGETELGAGRPASAEPLLTMALQTDPTLVDAAINLAVLYAQTNRPLLAQKLLRDTVARLPDSAKAWNYLACVLDDFFSDYEGAREAWETALRLRPDYPEALASYAQLLTYLFDVPRALELFDRALALRPSAQWSSARLFYSMYAPGVSAEEVARRAEDWDARFAAPLREGRMESFSNSLDPERPLRVGYVASTFSDHIIGWLLEPIILGHDRNRILPFCYSNVKNPDAVTERFRWGAFAFRDTSAHSDEQLAQLIRQDQIDILIDLDLHSAESRLGVFALRPAPIQINYLAYPFTGGLHTLDYRVTDAALDPPDQVVLGPEAPLRLRTSIWLYRPYPAAPMPATQPPACTAGHVTFANLNAGMKLNEECAAQYARILNRVPGSRLLQFLEKPKAQQASAERLYAAAGLDPRRIEWLGRAASRVDHLNRYHQADLCLDPFPYGGHTTALDALWMGVPVLTLAGAAPYSRGAASVLTQVGLKELICNSIVEYEDAAVALAENYGRLEALRQDLRGRMACSPLCDEKSFVADFEHGLRLAWRRHCQGLPPTEIDLAR